jgi:hypothetical protein
MCFLHGIYLIVVQHIFSCSCLFPLCVLRVLSSNSPRPNHPNSLYGEASHLVNNETEGSILPIVNSALKMEAVCFFNTVIPAYKSTRGSADCVRSGRYLCWITKVCVKISEHEAVMGLLRHFMVDF